MVDVSFTNSFQNSNCFIHDNQLQLDSISSVFRESMVGWKWVGVGELGFSGGWEKGTIRLKTEWKVDDERETKECSERDA
jgi:hypothetical protein